MLLFHEGIGCGVKSFCSGSRLRARLTAPRFRLPALALHVPCETECGPVSSDHGRCGTYCRTEHDGRGLRPKVTVCEKVNMHLVMIRGKNERAVRRRMGGETR